MDIDPPRDERSASVDPAEPAEPGTIGFEISREPRPATRGIRIFVWVALGVFALGIAALVATTLMGFWR